ncbi:hypothetical protein VAE122_3040261 [Vibrio aestuarianus]|nr:hypothetical protein VAE122_3040261 [Vibrio aestuarianus]
MVVLLPFSFLQLGLDIRLRKVVDVASQIVGYRFSFIDLSNKNRVIHNRLGLICNNKLQLKSVFERDSK